MPEEQNKLVEFERLNTVGKAVFIAGTAYKAAETIVGFTFSTLRTVWDETEKAFSEGLSNDSDEAVIIDETRDSSS